VRYLLLPALVRLARTLIFEHHDLAGRGFRRGRRFAVWGFWYGPVARGCPSTSERITHRLVVRFWRPARCRRFPCIFSAHPGRPSWRGMRGWWPAPELVLELACLARGRRVAKPGVSRSGASDGRFLDEDGYGSLFGGAGRPRGGLDGSRRRAPGDSHPRLVRSWTAPAAPRVRSCTWPAAAWPSSTTV
jgi:hypothetical protein